MFKVRARGSQAITTPADSACKIHSGGDTSCPGACDNCGTCEPKRPQGVEARSWMPCVHDELTD